MKFDELLLYYISKDNFLFEVAEVVGLKNTVELIRVFGGETIMIPGRERLKENIINITIYQTLRGKTSDKKTLEYLSKKYGMTKNRLLKIHDTVESEIASSVISDFLAGNKNKLKDPVSNYDVDSLVLDLLGQEN